LSQEIPHLPGLKEANEKSDIGCTCEKEFPLGLVVRHLGSTPGYAKYQLLKVLDKFNEFS
jgi:hypothetical protein